MITVTMPCYNVGSLVRTAVQSILDQTYQDWQLIIVNDAGDPPWPHIEDLYDPRIVCYDLPENRGRYFIDAVILEAAQPEWWAMQDPDDYSEPNRFEVMLPLAQTAGMAVAPWIWHRPNRPDRVMRDRLDHWVPAGKVQHRSGYGSAVISGDRLRQVGGIHPEFRVGWDTMMMCSLQATGTWATWWEPLYHRVERDGSLTTSRATGMGTPYRQAARARMDGLFAGAYADWQRHGDFASRIVASWSDETRQEVHYHADLLRGLL